MTRRFMFVCMLSLSMLGIAFGTTTGAQQLTGSTAAAQEISAAKKAAVNAGEQLKARGATMVPRSELPVKASSGRGSKYTCDKSACWCTGVKSCMKLTDKMCRGGFRCNNDGGQPVCWCDL